METTEDLIDTPGHDYTGALLRHFTDLRDGTHGGASSRRDRQRLYTAAVALLDAYARQALREINTDLLLGTSEMTARGARRSASGGLDTVWALSWPEQRAAHIEPIVIRAYGYVTPTSLGSARWSWVRELMSSFMNTLRRWYWTVLGLMNIRAPISGFVRPSRASRATWVSWGVS
jgi:hypothetical protein